MNFKNWGLPAYLAAATVAGPVWKLILGKRIKAGKEDPDRICERHGVASVPRPEGPILWVHALGIGEASAMISAIRQVRAQRPDITVLLTTNTKSGADGLARIGLPTGVLHQYAPIDTTAAVSRFLAHWRPTAVAIAELDLWPLMLTQLRKRKVPVCIVNARLTDHRFKGRQKWAVLYRPVLQMIDRVLVQDAQSRDRMITLGAQGARVITAGLLKAAAEPLPANEQDLNRFAQVLSGKPVWLASSTEEREVDQILAAHSLVLEVVPEAVLILVPRQPSAANKAAELCRQRFGQAPRRSQGDLPDGASVYVADTMGEMGLWYRLAPLSLICHSLNVPGDPSLSGKNPFEAVALGSVVLHGPNVGNFSESYDALTQARACEQVAAPPEIAEKVIAYLSDRELRSMTSAVAFAVLASGESALKLTVEAMLGGFPPAETAKRLVPL